MIKGLCVSEGIGIGYAYKLDELNLDIKKISITNYEKEIKRYVNATTLTVRDLEKIKNMTLDKLGEDHAMIFESHLLLIQDPDLIKKVKKMIEQDLVNAEYALLKVRNEFIETFESFDDNVYLKERALDVKDVTNRTIAHLTKQKYNKNNILKKNTIIICDDLTPSDTSNLDINFVKGIVTNIGGMTSHSAIMTRSLSIPCIVGSKNITSKCKNNDLIIVDAINNVVIVNPTKEEIELYENKIIELENNKESLEEFKNKEAITKDGFKTKIYANIESIDDLDKVVDCNAQGIGLFRTEFLYMNSNQLPTEEEQFDIYKKVLETMNDKCVVIRTLDIGGDKTINYLSINKEANPFLGCRAIRYSLKHLEVFKIQLRALLRASVYGKLKIMFPMISTLEEFIEAKDIVLEVEKQLLSENIKVNKYQIGMMVEVPSAAILADQFAKEVDFFSIGTNDLIQYTFAADRLNSKVSYLYQPLNPSILRLIKYVIDCAHKEGKNVGMCGEVSSDSRVIPLLISYGLDEFSMSTTSILKAKQQISNLNKKDLEDISNKTINCKNSEEVIELLNKI